MKETRFFNALAVVLIVFLVSLTVLVNVMISNAAKEGRYIGQSDNFRNTISVSGEGEVFAEPDMGMATFTVISEAEEVRDALADNTTNSNSLVEFLRGIGVEDRDMKTVNFNITPRYEYIEQMDRIPTGRRVLVGYQVIQSLEVRVREIDQMGAVVEGAVDAGANEVTGIRFVIENEEDHREESRSLAVEDAKAKAKRLADELGVELIRITNYSESGGPIYSDMAAREAFGMGGATPDIQTGENLIRTVITIGYEIR